MKVKFLILLLCFNFVSTSVHAGGQNGPFSIASLRFGDDGVYIQFSPAPLACNGGSQYRMHARVRHSVSKNYQALASVLLTAYTTKQTLRYIWYTDLPSNVDSCGALSSNILELTMLELTGK